MAKKPPKKASKKAEQTESDMEALVIRGRKAVEAQLAGLETLIEEMGKDNDGKETLRDKAVAATNSLTKSIAALSAEQRQLEKHTRLRLDRLSAKDEDAIVAEYLQGLPRPRRNEFFELLKGLDGKNDLLSL